MHATHEVFNQPEPLVDYNLYATNRPLQDALRLHAPGLDTGSLDALGVMLGTADMQRHARLAHVHTPQLRSHDRYGRRIDEVEFHPSYHVLMGAAIGAGLHGTPWQEEGAAAHVRRAAGFMLFTELEPSILCPVSMTYAATPALRHNPALHAQWGPRLACRAYDPALRPYRDKAGVTMGMGMTEKQGGSDVRSNTTRAEPDGHDEWGARYRLTGHKWFFSAPMSDAFLVLAQAPGGLSCFFLPRVLPDGSRNAIHIQRLKDKLGNKANASSEVEFVQATAWLVGEEGRGVPLILEMGTMTRLDCALGTSGLMRQALGTQAAPPNQVIIGLSLFLTFFVMGPTIDKVYSQAWQPYTAQQIGFEEALKRAEAPMREFMLKQTRESDFALFARLAKLDASVKADTAPMRVVVPAFVTSELKSAFQIGFMIFIPFLVIDMIVASVLMSLGMMMLSPVLVALPFKLMLFVLADGWNLLLGSLAASFAT